MPQHMQGPLVGDTELAGESPATPRADRRLFNPFELRIFRYTAVMFSLVALAALAGIILWALSWLLTVFHSLLLSLALAGVLSLVLHPVVKFFEERLRLPHLFTVVLVLVLFFAGLGGLIFLLVPTVVGQVVQLMTVLPEALESWRDHFSFYFPEISSMISARLESGGGEQSESVVPGVQEPGRAIMSYLGMLVAISFMPLLLFFTLLSGHKLWSKVSELLSVFHRPTQKKALYFLEVFIEYVTAFFQGQLIIAVCMGALYALSFTLIGLDFGVLAGLVLGLLNIIPFLGTLIGLVVVLPMAFLQEDGGMQLMVLTGMVFAAVQVVESWLLTPKIMANRSGLHPALVIIALFFWGTALGGLVGMILAVPLTAFLVAIWGEIKTSLKHTLSHSEDRH